MAQDDNVIDANAEPLVMPERSAQRVRSEIEFPYSDLEVVIDLVKAIHLNAGCSCEDAELAAWMNMSEDGGTYRARRSAARMFGLVESAQGRLSLTVLGRRIVDETDRGARIDAFLKPALFSALYEQYRGQSLPPAPTIERHIERHGVPPKQIKRARQVFQNSAHYAGFVDATTGRFRKPGTGPASDQSEKPAGQETKSGGGGGMDGGPGDGESNRPRHPLIEGLFQSLPSDGETWTVEDAAEWLQAAAYNLRFAYKFKGRIKVEIEPSLTTQQAETILRNHGWTDEQIRKKIDGSE